MVDSSHRKESRLRMLWRAITENFVLKVISVLMAILLFGQVRGGPVAVQRAMEIVLISHLPPHSARKILLTDLPTTVRVTVRGTPSTLAALKPEDLGPFTLDLKEAKPTVQLEASMLAAVPAGVEVVNFQPSDLQLKWDDVIERDLPVRTEVLRDRMATGVKLSGLPLVRPNSVRVVGGRQVVGLLQSVNTEPLDLSDMAPGSYVKDLQLIKPGYSLEWGEDVVPRAQVSFTLEQEIVERRFEHVPITVLGLEGAIVRPPEVAIVLRGTPQAINRITVPQLVPTVDLSNAQDAIRIGARFPVSLTHVPDGARLGSLDPAEAIAIAPLPPPTSIPVIRLDHVGN